MPTNTPASVKLSVAIIALNEGKKIKDCLQSVKFADEIILVDSGSADKTQDIAKSLGAKCSSRSFDGYSEQKNFAIGQCTGDWILSLDSDERISEALAKEIQVIIQTSGAADGYWIKRENYIFGKHLRFGSSKGGDEQLRLIRRGKGKFEGKIHERIQVSGSTGKLNNTMIHLSTETLSEYFKKLERYTTLEAESLFTSGYQPTWCDYSLKPFGQFIYAYFFKLGFLDGWAGLQFQALSSFYTFIKYAKLKEKLLSKSQ